MDSPLLTPYEKDEALDEEGEPLSRSQCLLMVRDAFMNEAAPQHTPSHHVLYKESSENACEVIFPAHSAVWGDPRRGFISRHRGAQRAHSGVPTRTPHPPVRTNTVPHLSI